MDSPADIERLIESLGGEIIRLDKLVKTVKQASEATGADPSDIIKSLVFIGDEPVLVIVPGDKKVDINKLSKIVGECRLANPKEAKMATGFDVGGMPPVGVPIKTIVDKSLLEKDYVIGGGGDIKKLCRISVKSIIDYQGAVVADVT